jgi:Tfp pilus assembly protein PilO
MMANLQNHVRWFIRAQWTLGGIMVTLFGSFLLFDYRPYLTRLHQLQVDLSQCQYELQENQAKTKVLPAVAADVKHLRQQLDASKKLPPRQELPQFLKDVTALGQSCNLHPFTFKQGMPTRGDLFCEQPINLTFEGNFVDAFNFLRQTEQMQRLIRVRNMSIKSVDGQSGRVEVQLSMNIYFAPE